MKDVFAIPFQYIKDIGLDGSAMLLYLIGIVSRDKSIPGKYLVNKKQMKENDLINFIHDSEFDNLIDRLYDFGFVHFHRKAGKKTRTVSISVVNIIMYELLGKEQYVMNLAEYETKKFCGKIIPYSVIDSLSFSFPEYKSMTSKNFYVSYCAGIEEVVRQVKNMYVFDIQKIDRYIDDGGNFISKEEKHKNNPANVCSLFMVGHGSLVFGEQLYHIFLHGGKISTSMEQEKEDDVEDSQEPTLKELARNSYEKFCEYLQIGQTMRKPILDWTARDFVSYIYCGLAKMNEESGDFVFPDFAKDCTRMRRLMDKYGNKRLNRVIYLMVKNTDEMVEFCRFKDFRPSPSILSVDWMFDKMLGYASYVDKEKASKELSEILIKNTDTQDNGKEEPLKKQEDDVKLKELREFFNKNKETK